MAPLLATGAPQAFAAVTLIMAVSTPAYAVLCTDRRITQTSLGKVKSQLDSDGKSFVFGSHYLAGFSGLATVEGIRMEAWLPNALGGIPNNWRYPHAVAERLTDARRRSRTPQDFTIAVLGVGWRRVGWEVVPNAWLLSNALDDDDEYDPRVPDSVFRVVFKPTKPGEVKLRSIGAPIDPLLVEMAESAISKCSPDPDGLGVIFDNLEYLAAAVAHSSEGTVGTAIQLSAMHRRTFTKSAVGVSGNGMAVGAPGGVVSEYRGLSVKSLDPASVHLPALIGPGAAAYGINYSPTAGPIKPAGERWPGLPD